MEILLHSLKWNKAHEELSSKLIALSTEECALQIEQAHADMTTLKADMADHLDLQSLENVEQATREKVKTFATELSARRVKKLRSCNHLSHRSSKQIFIQVHS